MSKVMGIDITENEEGEIVYFGHEIINDPEACRHMLNEFCLCEDSEYYDKYVYKDICDKCPCFERETPEDIERYKDGVRYDIITEDEEE